MTPPAIDAVPRPEHKGSSDSAARREAPLRAAARRAWVCGRLRWQVPAPDAAIRTGLTRSGDAQGVVRQQGLRRRRDPHEFGHHDAGARANADPGVAAAAGGVQLGGDAAGAEMPARRRQGAAHVEHVTGGRREVVDLVEAVSGRGGHEGVAPAAAIDDVVVLRRAGVDQVVPAGDPDHVVAGAGLHHVAAGPAQRHVVVAAAEPDSRVVDASRHLVTAVAGDDGVVRTADVDAVSAVPGDDGREPAGDPDRVVAVADHDGVEGAGQSEASA